MKNNEAFKRVAGKCRRILSNFTGKLFDVQQSNAASAVNNLIHLLLLDVGGKRKRCVQNISSMSVLGIVFLALFNSVVVLNIMTLGVLWIPVCYCFVVFEVYMLCLMLLWLFGEPAGAS